MKKIKFLLAMIICSVFLFNHTVSAAAVLNPACNDPAVQNSALCKENTENKSQNVNSNKIYGKNGIITKVVSILSVVIGFAAVVMIVIGGIKYIMSSGDTNAVNSAKNTVLYAVIGLAVAGASQALIAVVLNRL